MVERKQYEEVYKDGGWKEAFHFHLKTDSKIGIIATLGITAFAVAYAIFSM